MRGGRKLKADFEQNKIQYGAFMRNLSWKWRFFFKKHEREQIENIALWKAMKGYNPEKSKFITFLGRMLKWELLDNWNIEKQPKDLKTLSVILNPKNSKREMIAESMSVIDQTSFEDEDFIAVISKRLHPKYRQVFSYVYEGKTMVQISKELNITVQRVSQLFDYIKRVATAIKMKEKI